MRWGWTGWALMVASGAALAQVVAIDVGHDAAHPGAMGAYGQPEFEYNRALAGVVDAQLRRAGWITTRIQDTGAGMPLEARVPRAVAAGAALLVSIHHDSVQPRYLESAQREGGERFRGYSLFVSRQNAQPEASLACARAVGAALQGAGFVPTVHHAEPIEGENRPWADAALGVYFYDGLRVLRTAPMPALLVEAGVIAHRDEARAAAHPAYQERFAAALARGLDACRPPPQNPPQASECPKRAPGNHLRPAASELARGSTALQP